MSKLTPINDYLLVEHIEDSWVGGLDPEDGIRQGLVVDISTFMTYWGSHTYYFDSSAMNEEMLQKVHDKYKMLVGKIVYWPQLSESGAIIELDGKKYIFMKMASIMGYLTPEKNDKSL